MTLEVQYWFRQRVYRELGKEKVLVIVCTMGLRVSGKGLSSGGDSRTAMQSESDT